ncbi:hypothetical protein [Actinomadura alba]|uniref:Uncharacterized protein n=1 Tax=Actinomadura alba TaxID=406431 RepID=A0ABR7LQ61_9ACTN|nr:hypothetical protein [Actinomadura alba]MBC6466632.1 hypothetical protein [Actinomadura alba]
MSVVLSIPAAVIASRITSDKDAKAGTGAASASPVRTPTGEPLKVTKLTMVPRRLDHSWVMAHPVDPAALVRLNANVDKVGGALADEADPVMRAAGAVEPTLSTVEIEAEGNRPKVVRITGIRAVTQCRKPLNGTYFYNPPQGASDNVQLGFDLDSPSPFAQKVKPDSNDGPPHFYGDYFADRKYTLNHEDQVTFRLSARTYKSYCEYRYRFDLIVDGKADTQFIPREGERPLQITADIRTGSERFGLVDCNAYQRFYMGKVFVAGTADLAGLPSWNTPTPGNGPCE